MKRPIFFFLCFFAVLNNDLIAQPWMHAPWFKPAEIEGNNVAPNFYEIQKAFSAYEKAQLNKKQLLGNDSSIDAPENEKKFGGWAQFKRWESYMEPRVFPSGNILLPSQKWAFFQNYLEAQREQSSRFRMAQPPTANWIPLGPTGTNYHSDFGGSARVNFLRFHPLNSNIMWTGSPTGGLWKTTNGGQNWATNTDYLTIIGTSDIAIHPTVPDTMYLATGDANGTGAALALASIGVLKSSDGGLTWNTTGLTWATSLNQNIYKLLINPSNPRIVLAGTKNGMYRTTNSGTSWTFVQNGAFTDIEFKPGNPNVVYASSGINTGVGTFYRSTNAGQTWTAISSGLPLSSTVCRMEIGVTPADSNYVYVAAVKIGTMDFYGFYQSVDGGTNFSLRASTPNILSGLPSSQAWYNLAMAVNPFHKDTIVVGATYTWRSYNGGLTWAQITNGTGVGFPFLHPDHHALEYLPGSDSIIFSGNDGGVWRSNNNGTLWVDINAGLQIAQMYRLGTSTISPNKIATGHQDMGTHMYDNGNWVLFTQNTGDGMECVFEYDNDTVWYLVGYNGRVLQAYNTFPLYNIVANNTTAGVHGLGAWSTPLVMHPTNDSVLLIGKAQVYRTTNTGVSWSQVGTVSGGATYVTSLAYAPSNPNVIYAAKSNRVFVSTNGSTFTDLTGTLPVAQASITSIAVSNTDPAKVWVSFSGYVDSIKVFTSADTGHTWTRIFTNLPNLPVNCLLYQHNSSNGIYAGTDVGIYFTSDSLASWQSFFQGLPNVDVQEMEIHYAIDKIRAATNGRGLWESDLATPVPAFTTQPAILCTDQVIQFNDASTGNPTSWGWTFAGGSPGNSSLQNPTVSFSAPGNYNVTLRAGNSNGSYMRTFSINVIQGITASLTPGGPTSFCQGDSVLLTASAGNSYLWNNGATTQSITVYNSEIDSVRVTDSNGCFDYSPALSITVFPLPPIPTISASGNSLTSSSSSGNQWYSAGVIISGANGLTYLAPQNGIYSVTVTDSNGCKTSSADYTLNISASEFLEEERAPFIFPNPNTGKFRIISSNGQLGRVKITNSLGQMVYEKEGIDFFIDLSAQANGTYFVEYRSNETTTTGTLLIQKD